MPNAKSTLRYIVELPGNQSVMLVSDHGKGKSSVVKQAAESLGIQFHDVRLSQCEVGDIKGLPFLNETTKTTEFFKPRWWPRDMNSSGILFFDELNRANNEVQQAVFEIVLDRRLDGDYLPEGWRVVVAINGDEKYQVSELDAALDDRFFKIEFDPTVDEWLDWAEEAAVHPAIRQFVGANPDHLDPPRDMQPGHVYPSRRSWAMLDEALTGMNQWELREGGTITEISLGWVGRSAGVAFTEFFVRDFKLISGSDIINELDKILPDLQKMLGDPSAIATISRGIGKYLGQVSDNGDEVTDVQLDNLKRVIRILPREIASSVWLESGRKKAVRKHLTRLRETDPDFIKYITSIYAGDR